MKLKIRRAISRACGHIAHENRTIHPFKNKPSYDSYPLNSNEEKLDARSPELYIRIRTLMEQVEKRSVMQFNYPIVSTWIYSMIYMYTFNSEYTCFFSYFSIFLFKIFFGQLNLEKKVVIYT